MNMRLRHLRRLEEQALIKEQRELKAERRELKDLLGDEAKRRARLKKELVATGAQFGDGPLGRRRTTRGDVPVVDAEALEEAVERQPVTVVCSRQGWIRVLRGHVEDGQELKYKEGDGEGFILKAQTTDKVLLISSDGRGYLCRSIAYPAAVARASHSACRSIWPAAPSPSSSPSTAPTAACCSPSGAARGFVAEENAIAAQTRAGKQVFNLGAGERLVVARPAEGDHVAIAGSNRKVLIFPIDQLPVMNRGKGVLLQRYKSGELTDACVFELASGLSWPTTRGVRTVTDFGLWLGKRGQTGRMAPHGFPKSNRFEG